MKKDLHPNFGPILITCLSCGNKIKTLGTRKDVRTELCSNCHPFYSGKEVLIDTAGQVERFKKRQGIAATHQADDIKKYGTATPSKPAKSVEEMSNKELLAKIKDELEAKAAAKAIKKKPLKPADKPAK